MTILLTIILGLTAISAFRGWQGRWQMGLLLPLGVILSLVIIFTGSVPIWLWAIAGLWAMLSVWILYSAPVPHTPPLTGPYKVGLHVAELSGQSERHQVYLWYPANPTAEMMTRAYLTKQEAVAFAGVYKRLKMPTFLNKNYLLARTESYEDAPVETSAVGAFPMIMFNHGGGMSPLQNFSMMQELASHGYIVGSVSHPEISAGVAWRDGQSQFITEETLANIKNEDGIEVQTSYMLSQDTEQRRALFNESRKIYEPTLGGLTQNMAQRTRQVLDALAAHQAPGLLADILNSTDLTKIGFWGMSLGGSVSHRLCHDDDRAVCGINLDGMNWTYEYVDRKIPTPFLQVYSDPFIQAKQYQKYAREGIEGPTAFSEEVRCPNDFYDMSERLIMKNVGHMFFTDQSLSTRHKTTQQNYRDITSLCLATFDHHMKRESAEKVAEIISDNPDIVRQKLT